jgi:tRNA(Ile)-lysidine synthase
VSAADKALREDEANALFDDLEGLPGLILAVSGGPDSTALLLIAARWAENLKTRRKRGAPKLLAVTIDHGLRPQAPAEALAVKRLARRLGVPHRTLRWRGKKPSAGLPEAARYARYGLLAQAAARAGYRHILTAHTLDDQAETVLFRLSRGSGLAGLAGMARAARLPVGEGDIVLLRPFLTVAKGRLIATLEAAGIDFSDDPSNRDPRFTRARLRALMPALAREGLDAVGLARLSGRLRRADATVEFAVDAARVALAPPPWRERGPIAFATGAFGRLPAEVALRLLGRAIDHVGDEGPVELAKLEALYAALGQGAPLRRTLAGALITLKADRLTVERAPARRRRR